MWNVMYSAWIVMHTLLVEGVLHVDCNHFDVSYIGVGSGGAMAPPNIGCLSKASQSFVLPIFQVIFHLYG